MQQPNRRVLILGHSQVIRSCLTNIRNLFREETGLNNNLYISVKGVSGASINTFRRAGLIESIARLQVDALVVFLGSNDLDTKDHVDLWALIHRLYETIDYHRTEGMPTAVVTVEHRPTPTITTPKIYKQRKNGFNQKLRSTCPYHIIPSVYREEETVDGVHFAAPANRRMFEKIAEEVVNMVRPLGW